MATVQERSVLAGRRLVIELHARLGLYSCAAIAHGAPFRQRRLGAPSATVPVRVITRATADDLYRPDTGRFGSWVTDSSRVIMRTRMDLLQLWTRRPWTEIRSVLLATVVVFFSHTKSTPATSTLTVN